MYESGNRDWWPHIYSACAESALDQEDLGLITLKAAFGTDRLPWKPLLMDLPCFAPYQNLPEFIELLSGIDARQAVLLEKVQKHLAEF